jgi:hypothetical protein
MTSLLCGPSKPYTGARRYSCFVIPVVRFSWIEYVSKEESTCLEQEFGCVRNEKLRASRFVFAGTTLVTNHVRMKQ